MKNPFTQCVVFYFLISLSALAYADEIKIAYFTQDPPGIDPLSHSFDPDSYSVIAQIFDSLVYMDLDGNFKPALATSWKQVSQTQWHFTLRQGVKFHNGEAFNAEAVKFTFDYILNPKNNTGNRWIFNTLKSVKTIKGSPFEVIFETHFPDGMFLNRFHLFGSICPPGYIKSKGFQHFQNHPVGTGPFQFSQWQKGQQITLVKNERYWQSDIPHLSRIKYVFMPPSQWIEGFKNEQIDFIPNLSGNHTTKLMRSSMGKARIVKRPVLASYWALLKNQGALADISVRKALNLAVNKTDIIKFADFGNAIPMASLGKKGEFGANPDLSPYEYDPQLATELLKKANVKLPLRLKVLVADVAEPTAKIIQSNLRQIGVHLNLEVVSRSEWARKIVVHKMVTGTSADYDMVINFVDNPIYNIAFHAGLFLNSTSPWSLLDSPEFDAKFEHALKVADPNLHQARLIALDKYIHDNALMIFTSQKIITAAVRKKFDIDKFGGNGHLGYEILSQAKVIQQ